MGRGRQRLRVGFWRSFVFVLHFQVGMGVGIGIACFILHVDSLENSVGFEETQIENE